MIRRIGLLAAAVMVALALGSCMHATSTPRSAPPAPGVDSVTVTLWHMDEAAGVRCSDAGPFRLEMTAGPATSIGFGRFGSAREFTRAIDSFAYAAYNPVFDPPRAITIEAWVYMRAYGQYEDTPIVARWTQEGNQQSWLFAVVGSRLKPPAARLASPGYHDQLVLNGQIGQLVFAFTPEDASLPRAFVSNLPVPLERWTHVAVAFDGEVVRFFIDGRLDAQYATVAHIHSSIAPLLVGNYFDVRRLTGFSGELRLDTGGDDNPYYAFEGLIDELRISSAARTTFEDSGTR